MAAARTDEQGLSTEELEQIRDALANGRRPKVVFTEAAGQIAGQLGQVVELTDPAVSDEWVVVRFGRDELPFSPADLAVAPKGAAARRAKAEPEPSVEPVPEPEFKVVREPVPAPREEARVTAVETTPASAAEAGPKPAKRAAKAARPKGPAGLTVTLSYADGEWTLAATQGTKALAKPYVIKPAEALKMVALVDVPGVQEAVEQILEAERREAEQQAERLRAELAEVEARLAELRDAG
ncbi:hypothetical protein [Micromonospora sp. HM5-17]|jgi:hypothetical protein|uniref:hypothetical protein n=1 Tax=Micromonospora sp. HM5-17 TaxID=2487710 RepID=UPI000F47D940|nr:hypothetical protein [Micromonospora sp. HM5-17]ROT29549.1 hypothetical protein EF879_17955 [Micromonospora sp. HM5-17]